MIGRDGMSEARQTDHQETEHGAPVNEGAASSTPPAAPQAQALPKPGETVTASIVEVALVPQMRWACTACKKVAGSTDPKLGQDLVNGQTPMVRCPHCQHVHPIVKKPERKVLTVDEAARRPSYNPNLSPAANRMLGNVRR